MTEDELRQRLLHPDRDIRGQWQARVLREATYSEVWTYLTLADIIDNWEHVERHLGRRREFWKFLLDGWRRDGLLSA